MYQNPQAHYLERNATIVLFKAVYVLLQNLHFLVFMFYYKTNLIRKIVIYFNHKNKIYYNVQKITTSYVFGFYKPKYIFTRLFNRRNDRS